MTPELTEERIAEAMARAEKVACRPGDDRCYPLPHSAVEARKTCTPKGRCKIGWIVANSGRDSWDVWLAVHTGEGRLAKRLEGTEQRGTPHASLLVQRPAGRGHNGHVVPEET